MHITPFKYGGFRGNWCSESRISLVVKAANEPLASITYMENEIIIRGITE
jgi:hypothetical protein